MNPRDRIAFWVDVLRVLVDYQISTAAELEAALKENFFNRLGPSSYKLLLKFSAAEIYLFDRCAEQLGGEVKSERRK